MSEHNSVQAPLMQLLNMMPGIVAYRNNSGAARRGKCMVRYGLRSSPSQSGSPDIICSVSGLFVGIETKDEGERPTPEQYAWGEDLERRGEGIWIWGDSAQALFTRVLEIQATRRST